MRCTTIYREYLTSAICVYEGIAGSPGSGETNVRQHFGGVHSVEFTEEIALEAAQLQDELLTGGERIATRDLMIAATARSTGDRLVVADADFQTAALESKTEVTSLRDD